VNTTISKRKTYEEPTLTATLRAIAEYLEEDTDAYLIGGGAMMFYGQKPSTKDIDIVFPDAETLTSLSNPEKREEREYTG